MAIPKWLPPAIGISGLLVLLTGMKSHATPEGPVTVSPAHNYHFTVRTSSQLTADQTTKLEAAMVLTGVHNFSAGNYGKDSTQVEWDASPLISTTYTPGQSIDLPGMIVTLVSVEDISSG